MEAEIAELQKRVKERDGVIADRESVIGERDGRIRELEREVAKLKDLSSSSGEQASELQK